VGRSEGIAQRDDDRIAVKGLTANNTIPTAFRFLMAREIRQINDRQHMKSPFQYSP
jgi:hypothetical protein